MKHALRFSCLIAMFMGAANPAFTQSKDDGETHASRNWCAPKFYRWQDDCRHLAHEELQGFQKWRYVPLSKAERQWISFGVQSRTRIESLDKVNFGLNDQPDTSSIAHRFLVHSDFRTEQGPRLFTQLSYVQESGRSPGIRPFDQSAIDLAQAFVGIPLEVGDVSANLRLGRQELPMNSRLFSVRDGVILRRAFDAARIDVEFARNWSAHFVYGRPVQTRAGAFDDRSNPGEYLTAFELKRDFKASSVTGYYFDRRRRNAIYAAGSGDEDRTTIGARLVSSNDTFDTTIEGAYQTGTLGGLDISAWGGLADIGAV